MQSKTRKRHQSFRWVNIMVLFHSKQNRASILKQNTPHPPLPKSRKLTEVTLFQTHDPHIP